VAPKDPASGAHRVAPAPATLERLLPLLPVIGATRLSVVTGLDLVGIPVAMVCRPNSRSLSVSQGKGVDLVSAKVSAVGEAIESWSAEHVVRDLRLTTWGELAARAPVVAVEDLPRPTGSRFHRDLTTMWIEGADVIGGGPAYVPYELVHLDRRLPRLPGSGSFLNSSTGLASGNHLLEALSHALCEIVERDAAALWERRDADDRAERRLDLASVDDDVCTGLLARCTQARVAVGAWDLTTDVGLATFMAIAVDDRGDQSRSLPAARGFGCHPSRVVALTRAITEAAQSRLTLIAGSRDDNPVERDREMRDRHAVSTHRVAALSAGGSRSFVDVPDRASPSIDGDVALELDRLRDVGVTSVVMVDLTHPELGVPVVRAVVPGLEALAAPGGGVVTGPRAAALHLVP
jgi:ribosomal protein S12 methylthiotransferase accessory factor